LVVLRTTFRRVTNWRWCHIRTGFIVPLHWWWTRQYFYVCITHLLLWWTWSRWCRIYSWKIINLVTHQLINFLNHRKKGEKKRFSEAKHKFNYLRKLDACCCRHSLLKSRYDHLWKTFI
jgi:hypothetical protein